jgi:hypothetical protein
MSDEKKKGLLAENFRLADVATKNFKPTHGSDKVDPTLKPPFKIGEPVGAKPDAKPAAGSSNEGGKGPTKGKN